MAYGSVLTDVVQSSVTGSPPQFNDGAGTQTGTLCRAWCNYNSSTQTINASFNVSSVTYASTGRFTVNFANSLIDNKYSAVACIDNTTIISCLDTLTSSGVKLYFSNSASTTFNSTNCTVAVFR